MDSEKRCRGVYSDGSDYRGDIGPTAALYKPRNPTVPIAKVYFRKSTGYTVFEAKIMGIVAELELVRKQRRVSTASIGLDNQAAIKAISLRRSGEAQHLVGLLHEHLEAVHKKHPGLRLTIRWVPGQIGVTSRYPRVRTELSVHRNYKVSKYRMIAIVYRCSKPKVRVVSRYIGV